MSIGKMRLLSFLACFLMYVTSICHAQTDANAQATAGIKAADFVWMTGRWIGHLQNATAEQICSTPEAGEMLCLFRIFAQGRPVMFETYTLFDTPAGLELRSLHFSPDLVDKQLQQPLVLRLQKYSDKEVVFAGGPGSQVETSSLFRDSATTMNGVIMFEDQAQPHIRVRWEKVAYDAKVNYTPPPAARP
jgi:Domain of unknown function (DUF6265)